MWAGGGSDFFCTHAGEEWEEANASGGEKKKEWEWEEANQEWEEANASAER